MFKSAKTFGLLINDPNYKIYGTQDIRSIDQILSTINQNNRSLIAIQYNKKPINPRINSQNKKQKISNGRQLSVSSKEDNIDLNYKTSDLRVFRVIYGIHKPYKKHKSFSSDGFLTVRTSGLSAHLYSTDGQSIQSQSHIKELKNMSDLESGKCLVIGSNEVQIDSELNPNEFNSGSLFTKTDN